MKLKPEIIPIEQVSLEMPALLEKKKEMLLLRDESLNRIQMLSKVSHENKELEAKSNEQMEESIHAFLDEWNKARECYPEVRFGILQKIITFIGNT